MQKSSKPGARLSLLLSLVVLGVVAALMLLPAQFRSEAEHQKTGDGLFPRTVSQDDGLPKMWDIREEKTDIAVAALTKFRESLGKQESAVDAVRDGFTRGEEALKSRLPNAKIEYNTDIRIPEVITPDVFKPRIEYLSEPSALKRSEILRNFVKENNSLVGVEIEQINALKVAADYTNPDGNLSFAHLEQEINGIPVFRGEVKAGFTKDGRIIRVINNLAPGLNYESLSSNFGDPLDAVKVAGTHIKHEFAADGLARNAVQSKGNTVVFGQGDWATTAEKMYFPTEPGVAVPAWRVLIWQPVNAYYVIVDAADGNVLWHKNISDDQASSSTYQVYRNPTAYVDVADSPAPLSPGPNDPTLGTQGAIIARSNVTLVGNEGSNSFNNNGWITDGANITDGNAVEAGIDRDGTNGVDAPQPGAPNRVFDSLWNPAPGNPAPGDDPLTPVAQRGAVIQMFYAMNRYHDELYKRGFTEQARNFQALNFGRGGVEADRVSAEGQDSSGTNNANFATPADGGRGRMQMYIWTGPTPNYDGTADAEVIYHEVTHGTSNRLHGNGSGLGGMGGMMGEGWSDWYAETMLAEPTDSINGIYTTGGYATYLITAGFTGNYYYGIRRFPRAPKTVTGGPARAACGNAPCPHNPLSFRHLNSGCDTEIGTTTAANISAFARGPIGTTGSCSQVHNAGEVWSSALWEVRTKFVQRLGFAAGTTRVLQVVTDGMKLAPLNPTFLQERDAIIAGASALPAAPEAAADVLDVREGFRIRGMGFSASVQTASPAAVTEAFDSPDLTASTATVTSGNNLLEPNECNTLNVPITNNSANAATGITAVLSSTTPGITVTQASSAYPDMAGGAGPINNTTPFQVSIANTVACFTTANFTLTVTYTGGGGGSPATFNFSLPVGLPGTNYIFTSATGTIPTGGTLVAGSQADDAAVAVTLPAGWNSTVYGTSVTSLSASTNGTLTANGAASTAFSNTALLAAVGGTNPTMFPYWDDLDLRTTTTTDGGIFANTVGVAPNRQFYIEWKANHFQDPAGTAGTHFAVVLTEGSDAVRYIYDTTGVGANLNGASATVGIQKSSAATSPFTQFSFNTASLSAGLQLNGTRPAGVCTPGSGTCGNVPSKIRSDFDGDRKTDQAVFRPSTGTWYLNRSTAGFGAFNFGTNGDQLIPGDYDGDGKTDVAVFRPSNVDGVVDVHILNSNGFTYSAYTWGNVGDIPVFADYDNDGKTDAAIFRPSNNAWYVRDINGNARAFLFGSAGDIPLTGDFNGNGTSDVAVFRPSNGTWYYAESTGNPSTTFTAIPFGSAGDKPVPADYDGDGKDDIAVYRPSTGTWYIRKSSDNSVTITQFGIASDVPVPGDYDGDGKYDIAVFRSGVWYMLGSTSGFTVFNFGSSGDRAVPAAYIP
ncbi:MAG: M36 family metallopeptidase [Pyrinomonadaceae bacterium]